MVLLVKGCPSASGITGYHHPHQNYRTIYHDPSFLQRTGIIELFKEAGFPFTNLIYFPVCLFCFIVAVWFLFICLLFGEESVLWVLQGDITVRMSGSHMRHIHSNLPMSFQRLDFFLYIIPKKCGFIIYCNSTDSKLQSINIPSTLLGHFSAVLANTPNLDSSLSALISINLTQFYTVFLFLWSGTPEIYCHTYSCFFFILFFIVWIYCLN